ncbi:MAG TPA: TonB family protein [Hydrogenophilus thermoluteolus]|nr:TonB family protein [Hydrogenophilus thermoluteolus]
MPNAAPEPVAKTQVAAPLTPNTFPKPANRRERPPRKEQPARPVEQPVVARQTSSIATSALVPPIPSKKAPPADAETAAEPTPSATLEAHPAAATHGNDPAAAAAAPLAAPSPAAPAPTPPEPANAELKVFCTHRPPPPYPLVARRLGIEGVVTLRVTLTGAGTIVAAEIDRERSSTDHPALTAAALKAVRQWRCALPRASQDRTVTVWQPFRFQLHSG